MASSEKKEALRRAGSAFRRDRTPADCRQRRAGKHSANNPILLYAADLARSKSIRRGGPIVTIVRKVQR